MYSCILQMSMILFLVSTSFSKWTPQIPPECENEEVCDMKIPNYPKQALINRTIKKLQKEGYAIGLDTDPFDQLPTLGPNDTELCRSEFRTYIPHAARDVETNEWRFVINDSHRPVQVITIEVCSAQDAPCDKLDNKSFKVRLGYQVRCVQKFFHKALLGYNDTGHVVHFMTHLPMCCACVPVHL